MDIEFLKTQYDWCDMEFNDQLKRLRDAKGLTQAQMAELIGIAKNTYIGYEKGEREPRLSELKKMAQVLGMTISQICMETDTRSVEDGLVLMFEAVKRFDEDERKTFSDLVEALVIKHHANKAKSLAKSK